MKDRLVVTVSDVDGTKTYNLNKIIKKTILYVIGIIFLVISVSFYYISYINNQLDILDSNSKTLKTQNTLYSMQIKDKIKDIEELGETLKGIEDVIGIKGDDKSSLIQRATLAKLTSAQKTFMLQTIPNGSPLKKYKVVSNFGWRIHPISKKKKYHNGIDLRAKRGTRIYSTADGVVRYVQDRNKGAFGRMIIISHNFGFETLYAHLKRTKVKVGDVIKKGQFVGYTGNSGRGSGPHLHYEVKYASKVLNPKDFVSWNMKNYEKIFEKQRRVSWESLVKLISNQNQKLVQQ